MVDFLDAVKAHAKRVMDLKDQIATEEATKMALIVPFLRMIGYDPNDPRIVIPEYTADFGNKKECKVDYAVKCGGEIVIIVEAKKVGDTLDGTKEKQLQQYFQSLLSVKIAILTDGAIYKFYTDIDNKNVMDKRPFMTFDFSNIDEVLIPELEKLCNNCFDLTEALSAAQELKYISELKKYVKKELEEPSDDLIKFFTRYVYEGMLTAKVVDEFKPRLKIAFRNYINDILNTRLQGAMEPVVVFPIQASEEAKDGKGIDEEEIIDTQEEIDGYNIVKAIMTKVISPERVFMRNLASYTGILRDNKNNRPICRLHFKSISVKYIETFDENKKGTKHKIESISDIYSYQEALRATAEYYEKTK